jgi:hypothetical protein
LWADFPSLRVHAEYYAVVVGVLVVHGLVVTWRAALRNCSMSSTVTAALVDRIFCHDPHVTFSTYSNLHVAVWLAIGLSFVVNVVAGFVVNSYDRHHYRRYTQFLRLEFDTRLGMHSPR